MSKRLNLEAVQTCFPLAYYEMHRAFTIQLYHEIHKYKYSFW